MACQLEKTSVRKVVWHSQYDSRQNSGSMGMLDNFFLLIFMPCLQINCYCTAKWIFYNYGSGSQLQKRFEVWDPFEICHKVQGLVV